MKKIIALALVLVILSVPALADPKAAQTLMQIVTVFKIAVIKDDGSINAGALRGFLKLLALAEDPATRFELGVALSYGGQYLMETSDLSGLSDAEVDALKARIKKNEAIMKRRVVSNVATD